MRESHRCGGPNVRALALKAARIVWTKATLDAYISNPKKVVRGAGKMKYEGLDEASARAAIIDFLSHRN